MACAGYGYDINCMDNYKYKKCHQGDIKQESDFQPLEMHKALNQWVLEKIIFETVDILQEATLNVTFVLRENVRVIKEDTKVPIILRVIREGDARTKQSIQKL